MKQVKINLGCGKVQKKGFVGIDMYDFGQQHVLDIEKEALPFADSTVDLIAASHVMEHLREFVHVMNECWRVLKPGGELVVAVPIYPFPEAFQDPTHVRFFVPNTFLYFTKDSPTDGGIGFNGEFELLDMQKVRYELTVWMKAVK